MGLGQIRTAVIGSLLPLCLGLLVACQHHLKLGVPNASIGGKYECQAGGACAGLQEDDPALSNLSGTTTVVLPATCQRRFDEIHVLHPGDDDARVVVRCAESDHGHPWAVCHPAADTSGCRSTGHLILEEPGHTTVTSLPAQCAKSIYEILVLHAGRRSPRIIVTCAPLEQDGIPTMGRLSSAGAN